MIILTDCTYIDICHSTDIKHQKETFYAPRNNHTVKVMTFTDVSGKVLGMLPLCSSQSPSSGDGYLLKTYINLMDLTSPNNYFRRIIRGNNRHFVILVTDSGYVISARNESTQTRNLATVREVCDLENCVLLHPSEKYETYNLIRSGTNGISKAPAEDDKPTADENRIKFTRKSFMLT